MVFPYLLLLLISLYFAQADWVCPNATLDDSTQRFPPNDSSYSSGLNCTIKIAVKKGQYLDLSFANMKIAAGDNFTVYDETGTNYNDPVTGWPVVNVTTGANLYIKVTTKSSGTLGFQFQFPATYKYSIYTLDAIPNDEAVMLNLLSMRINTMTVITSTSPVAILSDSYPIEQGPTFYNPIELQKTFIYGGDPVNGTFLGSLYSFYYTKKTLIYDKTPYTVTVYQLFDGQFAALLFRSAASIQNIDYSFIVNPDLYGNTTLQLNAKGKPAVVTVYLRYTNTWLFSVNATDGQVDWLPGRTVPPYAPNLSFNSSNDLAHVPQLIPGHLNTFSTNSSSATILLSIFAYSSLLDINDYGYAPSMTYNLPDYQQNMIIDEYNKKTSNVTFTVINCYNYFTIKGSRNSMSSIYNMTNGSMTLLLDDFSIAYEQADSNKDTGGLMKYEVLPPPSPPKTATQQFIWFITIVLTLSFSL